MTAPQAHRSIVATLVAGVSFALLTAGPAMAAPTVSVTSQLGDARVSLDGPTTITVSGSGFQSVQGGFGGIYVMFGWVEDPSGGAWRPSNGGVTGVNYLYVPDTEARDNAGYQRFVTFPGSSTADAANGGSLAADGTWGLEMVVPGPVFDAEDRNGNVQRVDCTDVTCGVITIGAHGVINPNNESFTPLTFVGAGSSGGSDQQPSTGGGSSDGADASQDATSVGEEPVAAAHGPATLAVDRSTVIAGRVLGFTGRGFAPGEQVMASIGAGTAGAGPLVAGQFGEIAGAIALPADMRAGNHVLRLEGAGSGEVAETTVGVMADSSVIPSVDAGGSTVWSWAFIVLTTAAAALLAVIVASFVTALVRRRRARAHSVPADAPDARDSIDDTVVFTVPPDLRVPSGSGAQHPQSHRSDSVPARPSVLGGGDGPNTPVGPSHARGGSVGTS